MLQDSASPLLESHFASIVLSSNRALFLGVASFISIVGKIVFTLSNCFILPKGSGLIDFGSMVSGYLYMMCAFTSISGGGKVSIVFCHEYHSLNCT